MNWPTRLFAPRTLVALLLTSALFSLGSCEDPTELGAELNEPISTQFEDFPVTASMLVQDSLPTLKRDLWLAGRLRDGGLQTTITASSALELNISQDSLPSLFTDARLDSVIMFASFSRAYGNATQPVRLDVHKLTALLDERGAYTSSTPIALDPAPIASNRPVKLVRVRRERVSPDVATDTTTVRVELPLRLPLLEKPADANRPFYQGLFDKLNTAGFNQTVLNDYWKGIAVRPNDSFTGTIVGFNRTSAAEVYVYFHVGTKAKRYRLYFGDPVSAGAGAAAPLYYTQLTFDRAGGPLAPLQTDQDELPPLNATTEPVTYTQSGTGLGTKLVIPGLQTLRNRTGLLINRAELIIPVRPFTNAQYALPNQLYLYELNSRNRILRRLVGVEPKERTIQSEGANPLGTDAEGAFTLVDAGSAGRYYSGLVTSYVQAYATSQQIGELPAGFLLTPTLRRGGSAPGGQLSLDRAALNATGIRLRVYYSAPQ
ncbi:DUF4270 family protein [Hymenobacter sp. B81]|uniref:DUF4270 family protein n=1 Tax=Hymenobacter sp. B81 TaxID=3344878 RepID=UPI0037DDBAA8